MISKSLKEACYRLLDNYYGSALQESEARYGHLFENSPISLWEGDLTELNTYLQALRDKGITDLAAYVEQNPSFLWDCAKRAKVLDVNKAAVRLHNANSKEQLLGNLHKMLTQNSGAVLKEAIIAIAQRKNYFESEAEVTTLTGELKHVLIRVGVSNHGKGGKSSVKALVSVTDVTEHKQAERALRQSNQRLNQAQQVAGMGFLDWNLKTNELFCSDQIYQMYGISRGDAPTAEGFMQKVVHPDDLELVKKSLEQTVTGEAEYDIDHRVVRPDGQVIWVRAQAELIRDEDGNPETLLGTVVDITARKKSEEVLHNAEVRLKAVLDAAEEAIFTKDKDGSYTDVNLAFSRLFKLPIEELVGKKDQEIFSKEEAAALRAIDLKVLQHGKTIRSEDVLRIHGKEYIFKATKGALRNQAGEIIGLFGFAEDITERKQTEEQLSMLSRAVEQSPASVVITDAQGNIEYVNPKFTQVTGYGLEEVQGENPRILKSGEMPPEAYKELWEAITAGKEWRGEFHNKKKNGELFWESALIAPIKNPEGTITHFLAVKEDITARKAAEETKAHLEAQLRHAQKMETIGTLAGGIAHDFNNILQVVHGYADMALENAVPGTTAYEDLKQVLTATNRAKDLVEQILTFSRSTEGERKPLQIHLVVREALKLLRATLPSTIEIRQHIHNDCGTVMADSTQIHQVVLNLCTNAYQAMPQNCGTIDVTLKVVEDRGELLRSHPNLSEKSYVVLTVKDTGHGMDKPTLERVFEPFFTTKEVGQGTGLGLSVVHGIVTNHNGEITAESKPGKGATFRVYLPRTDTKLEQEATRDKTLHKGHERILFVDDDVVVASVLKRLIERFGYNMTVRTSSEDALETFRAHPGKFDVVITDQTMPKMTGLELAEKLRQMSHDIPIILMSGFAENLVSESAKKAGVREFLKKPVVASELSQAIRRALDHKL